MNRNFESKREGSRENPGWRPNRYLPFALVSLAPSAQALTAASAAQAYDWGLFIAGGIGILGLLWIRQQVSRL